MVDVTTARRPESFKCKDGQFTEAAHRCLMEFNDYGHHVGCRDGSHLIGCGKLISNIIIWPDVLNYWLINPSQTPGVHTAKSVKMCNEIYSFHSSQIKCLYKVVGKWL